MEEKEGEGGCAKRNKWSASLPALKHGTVVKLTSGSALPMLAEYLVEKD